MKLSDLPDINFVEKDVKTILADIVQGYENAYYEQTGIEKKLYPGDPIRIFLYSQALREYQLRQLIDYSAKQNLLKYADGEYLESLAADRGVERLPAIGAKAEVKFIFSAPLAKSKYIEEGVRVTPGNKIFFELTETTEVAAGSSEVVLTLECTEAGTVGNGYLSGQINTLVDPIPFVSTVTNIKESQGGADTESFDSLRERAWLAPESYSVAGSEGAYIFYAKSYSSLIKDVIAISDDPGVVEIYVLLEDGISDEQSILDGLQKYLSSKDKRPLTDNVFVKAPKEVNYDIDLTYYISSDKSTSVTSIRESVNKAVEEYILWQKSKIGRDINPDELIYRIRKAGAKRVKLISPIFIPIGNTELAENMNLNIVNGGTEDG